MCAMAEPCGLRHCSSEFPPHSATRITLPGNRCDRLPSVLDGAMSQVLQTVRVTPSYHPTVAGQQLCWRDDYTDERARHH